MADTAQQNFPSDESVIVSNGMGTTPPVSPTSSGTGTPVSKPKGNTGKIVATIFGVLLLVGGIGAGLLLVNQQQIFQQKAACNPSFVNGSTIHFCAGTVTISVCHCPLAYDALNHNTVCSNGQDNGQASCQSQSFTTTERDVSASEFANSCGRTQIDLDALGGGVSSTTGKDCSGGPTPTTPPNHGGLGCNSVCTQDSECNQQAGCGTGGPSSCIHEVCVASPGSTVKTCQNPICIGKALNGLCTCSTLNACGQPCSGSVGLCQPGSACRYIVGPSCSHNPNGSQPTHTYCVPEPVPSGWTKKNCVTTDQGNFYVLNSSGQNPTVDDLQQACAPVASPSPTPVAPVCSGVTVYDSNWNLLTTAQLAQLASGTTVHLNVASTSSTSVDKARFTINGVQQAETTLKRPNSSDYYFDYTIPAGTTTFDISAQVHDSVSGNWL